MRLLTRRTHADRSAEPFDVPDVSGFVGMVRRGSHLSAVLAATAPPPTPVLLPDGPRVLMPTAAITDCFRYADAHPVRIDMVTRTVVSWGDGPAARAYRGLLGPLAPASHRSVAVVVHIDPAACPDAVALRGGGTVGALRTALWCVRRVMVAAPATRLRPLSAAELSADGAWTLDETAIVARLDPTGVDGAAPPIAGDGHIVGAARSGEPVALRLAGPTVTRIDVAAQPRVVRQNVVRLAALGVRAHVLTDRPDEWSRLVDAVDDPVLLGIGQTVPPTAQVLVCDEITPLARLQRGLTVLQVHREDVVEPTGDYLLRQDLGDASLLHLVPPHGESTTVRTVTTAAERELVR